jgi:hypothetical protein
MGGASVKSFVNCGSSSMMIKFKKNDDNGLLVIKSIFAVAVGHSNSKSN